MYKVVIIALFCQLCVAKSVANLKSNNVTNIRKRATGFLLSMPKTLVSGENETICLSLHEAHLPARLLIDLKWKDKHHTTLKHLESDSTCFEIKVPLKRISEPHFISVRAQLQTKGEVYSAHNQDPILMYPIRRDKVFIETDRGVYKPGDIVKFLILQLNRDLLPVSRKISNIQIKNPMGITVMVWENVAPNHGIIILDYQMVSEALTGKWKLQVENNTKLFEVAKYSIPRFKIDIKYPKIIYYKTDYVNIHVCGRYSYNKPVAGLAFIKISDSVNNMESINKLTEMVNGCSEFPIPRSELGLDKVDETNYETPIYLHITATFTEYGTNKMEVATGRSKIVLKGYSLKFHSNPIFIPGVPYQGQLKLTNIITNTDNDFIEICYNLAIKKSWNYFNDEQCQNYTIGNDGIVPFKLWPLKNSVVHVHLHARSVNNSLINDDFLLVRLFSPSSSYIQLEKQLLPEEFCQTHYHYKVSYSSDHFNNGDNITFYYIVKSATEILQMDKHYHTVRKMAADPDDSFLGKMHKYIKLGTSIDQFSLNFEISKKFLTRYRLLVYYITKDGETVAATKSDEIVPCSLKVNSFWSEKQVLPGAMAKLNIKTASPALCAVSATDKANKFMSANNQTANLESILKVFSPMRESARSGRNSCISTNKKHQGSIIQNMEIDSDSSINNSRRKRRHVYSFSEDYDAYDILSRFGIVTITNLQVVTKPCYSGPLINDSYQVQFLTDHYETAHEEGSPVTIRSFFPENWLWELVPVTNSVQLQRSVPHSITNWVTNVFCVSESEGIGFAEEAELTSFQPFFVEVITPQSIKKGEGFSLLVHVSNYVNYTFPIKVSIRMSDNLRQGHQMSATYCLKQNGTATHNYLITGVEIGLANVTILVENESQYPYPCGPETIVSKRDVVFKTLQIEPEGLLMTNTKSVLLCASNVDFQSNVTWNLLIPKDIVPGTDKVTVTINADLLGQAIENLHNLVTIPTGCGEQIMASMAPNIYVLRYLNATGGITSSIRQRIIRNLKMGYQRILNYVHPDGSFSPFGYYDPSGSMFLTTFVVRVLQDAKNFIYVDQRVIDKAVNWIFSHQLENGCFDTMYHVFQDMGGTNIENSTAGLTSYVIFNLFDAEINVPSKVQTNVKFCIRSQHNPDKYSLVISSYALFKVHWISEAQRFLDKAIGVANIENDVMWWSTRGNEESTASDIEITSYALLAIMIQKTPENMAYAHAIVQWLTSKMSATGGFKSTQDTIVALDALTKYAEHFHRRSLDLNVHLEAHQENHIFSIKQDDRLKSKHVILQNQDGEVKVQLTGTGCALIQLTMSYYTTKLSESESFKLAVEVAPVSNVDRCSIKSISPCVSYEGPDNMANMAVMEMVLPSGYSADRSTLYELVEKRNDNNNIKKFEEKDDQINFYFTNLGKNQVCFSFNIRENLLIENRKESVVKLYDYYRPEQNILQFYNVINNCSNVTMERLQEKVPSNLKPEAYIIIMSNLATNSSTQTEEDLQELEDSNKGTHINSIKNRRKRETEAEKISTLNKQFTDVPVRPEAPACLNVPVNALYNSSSNRDKRQLLWLRYKRDTPPNLNKDFVDIDIDMETPNCINIPFYTPFLASQKNLTDIGNRNKSTPYVRVQRGTSTRITQNKENHMLNKKIVDLPLEPETGTCRNIPFYSLYNSSSRNRNKRHLVWLRYKRDTSTNLNKDFVDIDIDMETPNCINIPFYTPFPASYKNMTELGNRNEDKGTMRHSTKGPQPLHPHG